MATIPAEVRRPDHARPARQVGLDVARGLAVAGMVIVNFDLALSDGGGPAWLAAMIESVQGRASALFVVLAGVGLGLLSRSRGKIAARTVLLRGVVLLLSGLALLPLWPADILHFYGVWFILAAPTLGFTPRTHATLAALLVLLFPLGLALGLDYERHWNFATLEYEGVFGSDGFVRHLLFNGFHPTVPWLAFVFLGLALSSRLTDPGRPVGRLAVQAAAVAVAMQSLSPWLVRSAGPELAPLVDTSSMPPGPTYVVVAAATAVAVLATCVHICRSPAVTRASAWTREVLASAGRNALSLYVLHVVAGIVPLYIASDSAVGPRLERGWITAWWALWCSVFFLGAVWLVRRGSQGPLETLFRRVVR